MFFIINFSLNIFEVNYIFYMTKPLGYPLIDATIALSFGGVGSPKIICLFQIGIKNVFYNDYKVFY
ncbi:macrolide-efflux protein [Fructobacillus pseudoficulneus]|uniref:Macrolide-efflux protein n=1 Tax=Fructobacillus pseudoficulneus TaxID=220714 RepID=A0A3F3GW75_9LACO|nr:macrolide-efflux protein [Fructobacillus pseudoficulneus]